MRVEPSLLDREQLRRPPQNAIARLSRMVSKRLLQRRDTASRHLSFVTVVHPRTFRWCWLGIALWHVVTVVVTVCVVQLYRFLASDNPSIQCFVDLIGVMPQSEMWWIIMAFTLVAAYHLMALLTMVWKSIQHRRFMFAWSQRVGQDDDVVNPTRHPTTQRVRRILRRVLGTKGLLGANGTTFDAFLLSREVIEIAFQTVSTYRLSHLVGTVWINRLSVGLLVANCWSTPLIMWACANRPQRYRILCIALDGLLSFGWGVVVPFVIFYPYLRTVRLATYDFPDALMYDDVWFISAILENKQVLILSVLDGMSKLAPVIGITKSIADIEELLAHNASNSTRALSGGSVGPIQTTNSRALASINSASSRKADRKPAPRTGPRKSLVRRTYWKHHEHKFRSMRVLHVLLGFWGSAVLVLHFLADQAPKRATNVGCKHLLRPWFATKYPCAVLEIDCWAQRMPNGGNQSEVAAEMQVLEPDTLQSLIIVHCSGLVVPNEIKRFKNLFGMEIYNATLTDWPVASALTQTNHPKLIFLYLVRVNMSGIPPGLLSDDFPQQLLDIEMSVTNLTTLPDSLATKWPKLQFLYIEHSKFSVVPAVLGALPIERLSLAGNDIEWIPDNLFARQHFIRLCLSGVPIQQLPHTVGDTSSMVSLHLQRTNVSALPTWATPSFAAQLWFFSAAGSPLCAEPAAASLPASLSCSLGDVAGMDMYPLALDDAKRAMVAS